MEVSFKPSFVRDFKKLPTEIQKEVRAICFEIFPTLRDLRSFGLYAIKPISGFHGYYRIKLSNYRIGFKKNNGGIEFMRVKDRRDIYKFFP